MTWDRIALCLNDSLGFLLILRLLRLKLHSIYSVFCVFIVIDLVGSSLLFALASGKTPLDYRLVWLFATAAGWVATLWMVYALLRAILATFPGILTFSHQLLNAIFVSTVVIAAITARAEFALAMSSPSALIDSLVSIAFVLERVISTTALIALLATLAFVVWFPVQMPRNLVRFSFGFIAYFGIRTILLLLHDFLGSKAPAGLSVMDTTALSACFLFLLTTITAEGEAIPVRIGHSWEATEQQRLLERLEGLNSALLHSGRRS